MPTTYRYPNLITSFEPSPEANTQLICNNLGLPEWVDRSISTNFKTSKILNNLIIDANIYGVLITTPTLPYYEINDDGEYQYNLTGTGGFGLSQDANNIKHLQSTSGKLSLSSSFLNMLYTQFTMCWVWKRNNATNDQSFLWCEKTAPITNYATTPCVSFYSSTDSGGKYYLNIDGDIISTNPTTYNYNSTEWTCTTLAMAIIDGLQYLTIRQNGVSLYNTTNYITRTLPFSYFVDGKLSYLVGFDTKVTNVKYNSIYCLGSYDTSMTQIQNLEQHLLYKVSANS